VARRLAKLLESHLPSGFEVVEGWAWKPDADEFGPDVMVFAATPEDIRYTGSPELIVEVLSTDCAADIMRKARKYAANGL
jgi:Uma2 family endonuclease